VWLIKNGGLRGFYGYRTCPGFVQSTTRVHRGRPEREVVFGRLMVNARSPKSKVCGQKRGSARRTRVKAEGRMMNAEGAIE
jgi:hypothetical protein